MWAFENYTVTTIFQEHASGNYYRYSFNIELKRIGSTTLVAVLVPGSLTAFLGLMFILLERSTGERSAYLATILLTQVMFLVMITNLVPLSRKVPYFGILFLCYVIFLIVLTAMVLVIEKAYH